jgi:hypothetical protein
LDLGFFIGIGCILVLSVGVSWWRDRDLVASADPTAYGGAAEVVRHTALGQPVRFADFRGAPLLVVYGADWCADCPAQLAAVRAAAPPTLRVRYVVTSSARGYGHPATPADARAWAERFGLPPTQVLAADLTAKHLPALTVFDREGRIVLDQNGLPDTLALQAALQRAIGDAP